MSKLTKHALLSIAAICFVSNNATASENTSSPIGFLLSESGVTEADIKAKGRKSYTPHFGYEAVSLQTKNNAHMKIHGKNINKNNKIDNIHLNLGQDKAKCEELERKLTAKYGAPISQRNNIRVWELKNTDFTAGQARKITIMAGEEKGQYFVALDRKGPRVGNNPRTNASLRKTKLNPVKRINPSQAAPQVDRNIRD